MTSRERPNTPWKWRAALARQEGSTGSHRRVDCCMIGGWGRAIALPRWAPMVVGWLFHRQGHFHGSGGYVKCSVRTVLVFFVQTEPYARPRSVAEAQVNPGTGEDDPGCSGSPKQVDARWTRSGEMIRMMASTLGKMGSRRCWAHPDAVLHRTVGNWWIATALHDMRLLGLACSMFWTVEPGAASRSSLPPRVSGRRP